MAELGFVTVLYEALEILQWGVAKYLHAKDSVQREKQGKQLCDIESGVDRNEQDLGDGAESFGTL